MPSQQENLADAFVAAGKSLIQLGELLTAQNKKKTMDMGQEKKRVKKDVNAPKKNTSSYLHFSNENRPRLVKENPALPQTEIAKLLGEEWRNLTEQQKEPYRVMAEKDKARFDKEMETYVPSHDLDDSTVTKKSKITPPKEPISPPAVVPAATEESKKKKKKNKKSKSKH
ncbi:high mobility group box domain-containing protein [Halteromyces radiatus]|uniref:high mobility group box domain-containing protein n=1 Tax=Halteromyces radiatus TaxID=101107 RepID=UPI002220C8E1|nr:high mobility group box domain-containing protein [Halteromyces radiatus]KAI8093822.1 high mobility group box domain-containing protein [Halteromyces radiatus]